MIEREPVTVVVSEKGWIRALKGNVEDLSSLQFKGDDKLAVSFFAETISKILVLASDGRIFTLEAAKLPGGRGQGEPIRLMADIAEGETIAAVFPYAAGQKMLVAASDGRGFVISQDEMVGGTRKGKLLLNVEKPATAALIVPADGDHVAVIGENRKLLIFPLEQVPEMARGKGVRLQKYRDGGISDAKVFPLKEGLSWKDSAGRTFNVPARRTARLDRQPRRSRAPAAEGISEEQSVWVSLGREADSPSATSPLLPHFKFAHTIFFPAVQCAIGRETPLAERCLRAGCLEAIAISCVDFVACVPELPTGHG